MMIGLAPPIVSVPVPKSEAYLPPVTPIPPPAAPIKADWVDRRFYQDIQKAYPKKALRNGIEGKVLLECQLTDLSGKVSCITLHETPANYGFADTAIKVIEQKARLRVHEHSRLDTKYKLQIKFYIG